MTNENKHLLKEKQAAWIQLPDMLKDFKINQVYYGRGVPALVPNK